MRIVLLSFCVISCGTPAERDSRLPSDTGPTVVAITNVFAVEAPSTTDILFVLDDSCSMANEQDALSTNFPGFWQALTRQPTLWHIGLVTTDTNFQAGLLRQANDTRFVTPTTDQPEATMSALFSQGVTGSPDARPQAAIYAALGPAAPADNEGFYRPGAPLHIVLVTDDFDDSRSFDLPSEGLESWLRSLKPNGQALTFSSLVDPQTGADHVALTEALGGVEADITADPDWSAIYAELADLVVGLPTRFALAESPQVATLEVGVVREGAPQALTEQQWSYDPSTNTISLVGFAVALGDEIRVTYVPEA